MRSIRSFACMIIWIWSSSFLGGFFDRVFLRYNLHYYDLPSRVTSCDGGVLA